MKRIINGWEIVWAGERVFADRQNPPNYGYLFDVSADRKRVVRCAHLPAIGGGGDTTDAETRSRLERTQGKLSRSFCAKSARASNGVSPPRLTPVASS